MKTPRVAALAALIAGVTAVNSHAVDDASVVRGGRLYDHWSREIKDTPPREWHPGFGQARRNLVAGETWRCKECHGWNYAGTPGIAGITGRRGADPAAIMATLLDSNHRYGGLLREADLRDLANFVSQGQVDLQAVMDAARRASVPEPAHAKYYATICATCHGLDGNRLRESPPLGDAARQRPYEVLHVIINGHPGGDMPGLRALGSGVYGGLLRHLQTLPTLNLSDSIAHGGRLYDDWQLESGKVKQAIPHPAYPRTAYYAGDAALTWRCKSCHGWDYQGNQGNYASGRHATGIKGIRASAGADPARVLSVLRDGNHLYDAVLKERDLHDLANFVSAGQLDMESAIDRASRSARGDAKRAAPVYATVCANCHGIDGRRILTAPPLGAVARSNPWESLHKIANGHPNERMPALRELNLQLQIDILAFLQSLPEAK